MIEPGAFIFTMAAAVLPGATVVAFCCWIAPDVNTFHLRGVSILVSMLTFQSVGHSVVFAEGHTSTHPRVLGAELFYCIVFHSHRILFLQRSWPLKI